MKTSIIYFTENGNTAKAAEIIKDGMMKVEGTEARLFGLDDIDEEYVAASDAVTFRRAYILCRCSMAAGKILP